MRQMEKIRRYALDVSTFGAALIVVTGSFVSTAPEEPEKAEAPPAAEAAPIALDGTMDEES